MPIGQLIQLAVGHAAFARLHDRGSIGKTCGRVDESPMQHC